MVPKRHFAYIVYFRCTFDYDLKLKGPLTPWLTSQERYNVCGLVLRPSLVPYTKTKLHKG